MNKTKSHYDKRKERNKGKAVLAVCPNCGEERGVVLGYPSAPKVFRYCDKPPCVEAKRNTMGNWKKE